jgi:hypothetical protein
MDALREQYSLSTAPIIVSLDKHTLSARATFRWQSDRFCMSRLVTAHALQSALGSRHQEIFTSAPIGVAEPTGCGAHANWRGAQLSVGYGLVDASQTFLTEQAGPHCWYLLCIVK